MKIRGKDASYLPALALEKHKEEYRQYLKDTDWYAVRFSETGKPIPPEVLNKRAEARSMLSQ